MAEIVPAILTNDISDFRKKYAELFALRHYFNKLHIDFADSFVHTRTIMPVDLKFLPASSIDLMAHFMTYGPDRYFEDAKKSGFSWVMFHFEAFNDEKDIEATIAQARDLDLRVGLVINPETPLYRAGKFLTKVDLVQLMSIHPGGQGRNFIPATIHRIKELKSLTRSVIIAVDGGIKVGIARQCVKSGADLLVTGSAILRSEDEEAAIEVLKADIETNEY